MKNIKERAMHSRQTQRKICRRANKSWWLTALVFTLFVSGPTTAEEPNERLNQVLANPERTPAWIERDPYRHPGETLSFFQVEPTMTVVEIWPGRGWYTEILGPYLAEGKLYAAQFSVEGKPAYYRQVRTAFEEKVTGYPGQYPSTALVDFDPDKGVLEVPSQSADRVLTFRNVHNWLRSNSEARAFELFFKTLKPGGLLGVVEHRAPAGTPWETMESSGYVTEAYVIELAQQAGFRFAGRSDINANPKDTANHPEGVWTLPPSLRLKDQDRKKYLAIGESDRMTLLFIRPAAE